AGLAHAGGDDDGHVGWERRGWSGAVARTAEPGGPAARGGHRAGKAFEAARHVVEGVQTGPLAAPEGDALSGCRLVRDDERARPKERKGHAGDAGRGRLIERVAVENGAHRARPERLVDARDGAGRIPTDIRCGDAALR